jgi:deoxyribonuclease V
MGAGEENRNTMYFACDVQYEHGNGYAAGVCFDDWQAETITQVVRATVASVAEYEPGAFYRRELPCLLALLQAAGALPKAVLVDGYVWLKDGQPALGARLFEATGGQFAVIGVAKSRLRNAGEYIEVKRNTQTSALFVSSVGITVETAAAHVAGMHGKNRLPTILEMADREARKYAKEASQG